MCSCECCITDNSIKYSLLKRCDCHLKQLKEQSHNEKDIRYGEIESRIFETFNNFVIPHGYHIYNTYEDMDMETMCPCPSTIMGWCTGNVCYVVVKYDQLLSYPVSRQIKIQQNM